MNTPSRRTFLKSLAAGAAMLTLPRLGAETGSPPAFARTLPSTPFDGPAGSWTLAVLPDTQNLAESHPAVFMRQTEWIAAHRASHRILFVAHEGDIVNKDVPVQWENARQAMGVLGTAGIPYCLLPGNHDLESEGGRVLSRKTLMNDYFNAQDYRHSEAVGYFEAGRMENSWHELTTPTGRFLLVALELGPRDAVLDWANEVIVRRPDRQVIVVTHSYLYFDDTRQDWATHKTAQKYSPMNYPFAQTGSVNDGEAVWRKLVSRHPHIRLLLCGHVLGDDLVSPGAGGRPVHQILANYQSSVQIAGEASEPLATPTASPRRYFGGGGFLRLMQFQPGGGVQVKTYSPWYDRWLTAADQQFNFTIG
jgi:hypothetical protein